MFSRLQIFQRSLFSTRHPFWDASQNSDGRSDQSGPYPQSFVRGNFATEKLASKDLATARSSALGFERVSGKGQLEIEMSTFPEYEAERPATFPEHEAERPEAAEKKEKV